MTLKTKMLLSICSLTFIMFASTIGIISVKVNTMVKKQALLKK